MSSQKLFPLVPGGKKPVLEGDWKQHATDDEAQISAWERAGYNLAIRLATSGLCVIDLDGPTGAAAWVELCKRYGGEPRTYTVKTPHGRHLYFRGSLRNSVKKLGPDIDTRGLDPETGKEGYVLVEGCEVDGVRYEVEVDAPYAPLPDWVPFVLEQNAKRHEDHAAAHVELDLEVNVSRAERYLEQQTPLEQGQGADERLYEIGCALREFGVSKELSAELCRDMLTFVPADDRLDAFIARKLDNAWNYAQNQPGAWAVGDLSETFGSALDKLPEEYRQGPDLPPDPFHAYPEREQDRLLPPQWLYPDLLPANSVVVLYGPPGTFKSFLALDVALTMAAGVRGCWGFPEADMKPVIYVAGEGPRSIARLRRPAWRAVRGIEGEIPFYLVTNMPLAAEPETYRAFIASIKAQGIRPRLLVLDTYARFMLGLSENDSKDAGMGVKALEEICRGLGCTVLVVHHTGKDGEKGLRGSNALLGGVDTVHRINRPSPHSLAVEVINERQKDSATRDRAWHFEGQDVAGSLVFRSIDAKTFRDLTQTDHELDGRVIGATLLRLKAIGRDKSVSTRALATTLRPVPIDEPAHVTQEETERLERKLRSHAKFGLKAYCDKGPKGEYEWFLAEG